MGAKASDEDYTGARTIATIEHLGETFRIVRARRGGKPWPRQVALLHAGAVVAHLPADYGADTAETLWRDRFKTTFTDRKHMLAEIERCKTEGVP